MPIPPGFPLLGTLPDGVRARCLQPHADARGALTELFRHSWKGGDVPLQWNLVQSQGDVMRGVHVHLGYDETYVLLAGRLTVGFRDTRRGSPTEGATALVELSGERPFAVTVPPGIAHGLLFREVSSLLIGVTSYWDPKHELGCHWLDPNLGIAWPTRTATLSARDAAFPPLAAIASHIPPWAAAPTPGSEAGDSAGGPEDAETRREATPESVA